MNLKVISPRSSMIEEIVSLLPEEGIDLSEYIIVFPGRRPGHFLRKALAERAKSAIFPPVIRAMDEFIDGVYEGIFQKRKIGAMDAVAILHDIHINASSRIGVNHFLSLDNFFPVGIKIFRDIEELLIEQVPISRVKEINDIAAGCIPSSSFLVLQSLAHFYEQFYKRIDELGFSTRSVRYEAVGNVIDDAPVINYRKMIFAGFFALTRSEQAIFRKLLDREDTYFIFQKGSGLDKRLKELGISKEIKPDECPLPEIRFYSSPDSHGQIFALNAAMKSMTLPDEKTAVILPSSDMLFALIRQGLSGLQDNDYNISMGYPLERTPLFGFFQNLMDLIVTMENDRVYLPAYLNFVLNPYTKNIYFKNNAEVTRILFHTAEEIFSGNSVRVFASLEEIENETWLLTMASQRMKGAGFMLDEDELRDHLRNIHSSTIGQFLLFNSVSDFSSRCTALLTYIFNNSSARFHPLFGSFAEAFLSVFEDIEKSLLSNKSFSEPEGYFVLLRRCLRAGTVPFDGTPVRGLQVLGMLETRGLKFDKVFVMRANEDVLPAAGKEDSLLPFKARRMLGLPTYIEREQISAYNFDTLVRGSNEVHIFFIESDLNERSRFVERLLWQRQQKDKKISASDYIMPVQYKVKITNVLPAEIVKTQEISDALRRFIFSPSALNTYFRCPLKFYYQYILRIGRQAEFTGEIDRTDIGKSVHKILNNFFSEKKGRRLLKKDMDAALIREMTRRHFSERYGKDLVGAHYLLEQQVASQLAVLLESYYLPLVSASELEVIATEYAGQISIDGCRLEGRMDSIERRNGKICIIDYKTGASDAYLKINHKRLDASDPATWRNAIGSLQLPCYVMIYSEKYGIDPLSMDAMYLMLGRTSIGPDIEVPLFGDYNSKTLWESLNTIIRSLLKEITDPDVAFLPAHDKKQSCPDCDFRFICGTQWIAKKR